MLDKRAGRISYHHREQSQARDRSSCIDTERDSHATFRTPAIKGIVTNSSFCFVSLWFVLSSRYPFCFLFCLFSLQYTYKMYIALIAMRLSPLLPHPSRWLSCGTPTCEPDTLPQSSLALKPNTARHTRRTQLGSQGVHASFPSFFP